VNIEWDESKNQINTMKHGVSFDFAAMYLPTLFGKRNLMTSIVTLNKTGLQL